jgi:hypothetical protein
MQVAATLIKMLYAAGLKRTSPSSASKIRSLKSFEFKSPCLHLTDVGGRLVETRIFDACLTALALNYYGHAKEHYAKDNSRSSA